MSEESKSGEARSAQKSRRSDRLNTAGKLEHITEFLVALALIGMLVLIAADVTTRTLFGFSYQVSEEISGYLLVAITFLSLSVSYSHDRYHRVEFFQARLSPRGRLWSRFIFDLAAFIVCGIMAWQFIRFEAAALHAGAMAPTVLMTPLWIPQMLLPVGATLACIAILRTIVVRARLLFAPGGKEAG
jgi:TRAP-type C4-dicarboxylate transport system permease small subunit